MKFLGSAVAALAGAAFLFLSSNMAAAATMAPRELDPRELDQGRLLFENACSSCHGATGLGTVNGPALTQSGAAGAHFMLSTGRMPLDDPERQPIRKPPAFNRDQIRTITAFVATLGTGPDIPKVNQASGDLVKGEELYSSNCGACHSSAGAGGAVGAGQEAPSLGKATPVEIVEAMRIGPGAMPVFGQATLSDNDADSIARYLIYLRTLPNHGGWGMGRVGPIPEGFVALAGMGALLAVCRWIGTRS